MTDRHHRRVHARAHRAVVLLGDREQLHDVAELGGGADVVGGDVADAFARHVAGDDAARRTRSTR